MDGTVSDTPGGTEIRFERRIRHPVERVWTALTDPAQRAAWFFAGTLEPVVGGRVNLVDSEHGVTGRVVVAEPPHLLELTWSSIDAPTGTVRFELVEDGDGCLLVFTHRVDASAHPENLLPGWHCIFDDLVPHLGADAVVDRPGRFALHQQRYRAALEG